MAIEFVCPHPDCRQKLRVSDDLASKKVKCPKCQTVVVAPLPGSHLAPAEGPAAEVNPPPSHTQPETTPHGHTEELEQFLEAQGIGLAAYDTEKEIAHGGMGAILLCRDKAIGRPVAMKVMKGDLTGSERHRLRFLEEAQVTGQLEHPNIVPIHELGKDADGNLYFTMKLVKGRSLAEILKDLKQGGEGQVASGKLTRQKGEEEGSRGPEPTAGPVGSDSPLATSRWTLPDLLGVFLKVCDAIAFAHSRGVIHRDLKPANVMVGEFGEVLVMDWGLAKVVASARGQVASDAGEEKASVRGAVSGEDEFHDASGPKPDTRNLTPESDLRQADTAPAGDTEAHTTRKDGVRTVRSDAGVALTLDGQATGTPAYMPPEQAEGKIDQIDHRSDIYSLGAILYEILTFERPVEGDTLHRLLLNVADGKIIPPDRRTPGRHIPKELSAVVMKAMAKNRRKRYQSVQDLSQDIKLFLEGRAVSAKHDTFLEAFTKLVKRNKGVSAAVAAAAIFLAVSTSVFVFRVRNERDRVVESERKAVAAEKQRREDALAASEQAALEALAAAESGRWAEAATRAQAAMRIMKDGPWGHYAQGVVAWKQKEFAEAETRLKDALQCDGNHQASKDALVQVLTDAKKVDEALSFLAGQKNEQDWLVLTSAGETLFGAGRHREAEKALGKALDLIRQTAPPKEKDWAKLVDLGQQLLTSRRYPEAKAACDQALKLLDSQAASAESRLKEMLKKAEDGLNGLRQELEDLRAEAAAWVKCEGFYESTVRLPPEEQVVRTQAKFDEIHGKDLAFKPSFKIEEGELRTAHMPGVRFLQALRGLPLRELDMPYNTEVRDLTPLRGMPLVSLNCLGCQRIHDISPLKGMPLKELNLQSTRVADLRPLKGMPLEKLDISGTQVVDLRPLEGVPLTELVCDGQWKIEHFTPLRGMPLRKLNCFRTLVSDLTPLRGMPLEKLCMAQSPKVRDLGPLAGLALKKLEVYNCKEVTDVTPLKGMSLVFLGISGTAVEDFSPLTGMPLECLVCSPSNQRLLRELVAAIKDTPSLRQLSLGGEWDSLEPVRGLRVTTLNLTGTKDTDLTPLKGMPLENLSLVHLPVTDLTPLKEMRLKYLYCDYTGVTDLTPLKGLELESLVLGHSPVTDLTPLEGMRLRRFDPPAREQLTPESLKVIEELQREGCSIGTCSDPLASILRDW